MGLVTPGCSDSGQMGPSSPRQPQPPNLVLPQMEGGVVRASTDLWQALSRIFSFNFLPNLDISSFYR